MKSPLLLPLLFLVTALSLAVGQTRPNIILLMGDDHGWEEVGYNNHPHVKTPFLDEMASTGLRMDYFYAQPVCSPTRGNVLTGRHPNRYGIFGANASLRPEEITVAHLLKKAGYATAHFGKWHVGPVKRSSPTGPGAMGFDHWLSHDNFFEMDPVLSLNGAEPKKYYGESSEILIDEAIDYMKIQHEEERPFFLVIWYGSPHEPHVGMETDLALYRDLPERYENQEVRLTDPETGGRISRPLRGVLTERYAEITAMDRSIGKLRNTLKTLGLRDNTVVWYFGDNGIPPTGLIESELRGLKGTLYENGIRVPAVIEWPAGIPKPGVSKMNAVAADVLPTLCALAGEELPDVPLDGINLIPHIQGGMTKRPKPIAFWDFRGDREQFGEAYIDHELQVGTTPLSKKIGGKFTRTFWNRHYKAITEKGYLGPRAIISDNYKLVIDGEKNSGVELFDLRKDPGEKNNLAESHSEVVEDLEKQLRDWQTSVLTSLIGEDYKSPKPGGG